MVKILIAEDDEQIRKAYSKILSGAGYETYEAADGQIALTAVKDIKPDLILLDLLMPNMNGLEFLEKFSPKEHPETKVLVVTNIADSSMMRQAADLGVTEYLVKAIVTPEELLRFVELSLN